MSRALYLPEAIRAEGVKVAVVPGWKTRGRDFHGDRGVMFHHTAAALSSNPAPSLRLVTEGTNIVPGPLAQILTARDLTVWIVASGRANHGGLGGPWRTVPKDSANEFMIGNEVENNGFSELWRSEMLDVTTRVHAAVLKVQKKDASWLLAHREWTTRKIDPWGPDKNGNVNMNRARQQVADYLKGGGDEVAFQDYMDGYQWARDNPERPKPPDKANAHFTFGFRTRRLAEQGRHGHPYAGNTHVHEDPGGGGPHGHPDLSPQTHIHETGPAKG